MFNGNEFLNWDHEVFPTPAADIAATVASIIHRRSGFDVVASVEHGHLKVMELKDTTFGPNQSFGTSHHPYWSTMLDIMGEKLQTEVVGRSGHFLTFEERMQLAEAVNTLQ